MDIVLVKHIIQISRDLSEHNNTSSIIFSQILLTKFLMICESFNKSWILF